MDHHEGGLDSNNSTWSDVGTKPISVRQNEERPFGYYSHYAKRGGPDENQAETARGLMSDTKNILLMAEQEPQLRESVEMVIAEYSKISGGAMDRQYFEDLANGVKIDIEYWSNKKI